ncbi:MAG: energy-coupling factor ABC transporter ATP-binding protein [Clostridiales bacterium]|nr:energy-coupling factor ABC transporter ATP-binding protein [Clostridiales bacterium]
MHDTREPFPPSGRRSAEEPPREHHHPHERGPASLDIRGLSVAYSDGTRPLNGVSLHLDAGEKVAVIGANGAGKTSLLLTIVGVLTPAAGSVVIGDVPVDKEHILTVRRKVGLVFQNPDDQLFMPRVYDDVAFGPRNYGHTETEVREKVETVLSELGVLHLAEKSSLKLSGGEKRVCSIASVLVMNPRLLLFDEPTAFLDQAAKRRFMEILGRLEQTRLIATHDPDFARIAADRAVVLENGGIVADGPVEEVL